MNSHRANNSMLWLDSCASVGRYPKHEPLELWSAEDLLNEMDWVGIHGALITHTAARYYAPEVGNKLVLEETARNPRLLPCWVVTPALARQMGGADKLVAAMLKKGVHAAKMFPLDQGFMFDRQTLGPLLMELEKAGVPLLIEAKDAPVRFFQELRKLAVAYSNLRFLAQAVSWAEAGNLLEVMDRCENVMTECSLLQLHNGIEFLSKRYGPERILFGSGGPRRSMGAARAFVDYTDIAPEAKRNIAGQNLAGLLCLDTLPDTLPHIQRDAVMESAMIGTPVTAFPVLDAHTHVLHEGGNEASNIPMPGGDIRGIIARGRRIGITRLCVSAWAGITFDADMGNSIVEKGIKQFPETILGYATVDPTFEPCPGAATIALFDEGGFIGLKPYPSLLGISSYQYPMLDPWWRLANERKLLVLMHPCGSDFEKDVDELACKYPTAIFIMAHSGATWKIAAKRGEVAARRPNVYAEITYTDVPAGVIEHLAQHAGADKVLFGTDAPMRDPAPQFGWVAYSKMAIEDKRKIFGENLARILAERTQPVF